MVFEDMIYVFWIHEPGKTSPLEDNRIQGASPLKLNQNIYESGTEEKFQGYVLPTHLLSLQASLNKQNLQWTNLKRKVTV